MRVSGLVLAGGRGSRLAGADKGWIEYRGQPLIRHAVDRLAPQVGEVIVSANRNLEQYRSLGLPVVADAPSSGDFSGPLAGILAGMLLARSPWLAVVPCDAPHAPPDLVSRLRNAMTADSVAAVVEVHGRMEPLFCLVRRDQASSLAAFLAAGRRKVASWLEQIGAVRVPFEDPTSFANLNTPADLAEPR